MQLTERVAIVTGAAQGIGREIARQFAAEGAAVVIADVHEAASQQTVQTIRNDGGRAISIKTDVSDRQQVAAMVDGAMQIFGRIDILVNNAALVHAPRACIHFLQIPDDIWQRTLAVNLSGTFYCSQQAARLMVAQGEGGCIINISSGGATRAHRHLMAYDTTKGGLEAATRAMALDLAPWQIRVNTLVPGSIPVPNAIPIGPAPGREVGPQDVIPLGRSGTPQDLAHAAVFLASPRAAYITGQRLVVDGGMEAQLRSPRVDVPVQLMSDS